MRPLPKCTWTLGRRKDSKWFDVLHTHCRTVWYERFFNCLQSHFLLNLLLIKFFSTSEIQEQIPKGSSDISECIYCEVILTSMFSLPQGKRWLCVLIYWSKLRNVSSENILFTSSTRLWFQILLKTFGLYPIMHWTKEGLTTTTECAVEIVKGNSSGVAVNSKVSHLWSSSFFVYVQKKKFSHSPMPSTRLPPTVQIHALEG